LKTPVSAGYHEDSKYYTITLWGPDSCCWMAYVTMIPSGYEAWINEANTIMMTCIGSTYSAETECSRIMLTKGLSILEIGDICVIPFQLEKDGLSEPSFDIVGKGQYTSTDKRNILCKLAGEDVREGVFIQIEGWLFRFFTNIESLANSDTITCTDPGWHYVIIGGLKKNLKTIEILYAIRQVINTTVVKHTYTRKMLNSKEIILYTNQEINQDFVIHYILKNFNAAGCDLYCYTQLRLPGKDRVTAYCGLRDEFKLCTGVTNHRPKLNV
jgi:hypothetical protein